MPCPFRRCCKTINMLAEELPSTSISFRKMVACCALLQCRDVYVTADAFVQQEHDCVRAILSHCLQGRPRAILQVRAINNRWVHSLVKKGRLKNGFSKSTRTSSFAWRGSAKTI